MKHISTLLAAVLLTATTYAQVGINNANPDASAALDITSTTGGLLVPRMTEDQRNIINSPSNPATGLMVYQTDGATGFYYYNGSSWTEVGATSKTYELNTFYAELGGYVIDINSDGKHGVILAMQDQGYDNWFNANNLLNNPDNHDTDGAQFKNWRLPSKRELNLMYLSYLNGNPTNLAGATYWSSSEFKYDYAWLHYFFSGQQDDVNKVNPFNIRTVRSF